MQPAATATAARQGYPRPPSLVAAVGLAVAVVASAVGCGTDTKVTAATGPSAGGVTFNGSVRAFTQPSTLTVPTFSGVSAALVGFEALADANQATPAVLARGPVQSAANACMAAGCAFHLSNVVLGDTSLGLFALTDAAGGTAAGQWQPVYALVASPNQVAVSRQFGGAITAFAPATLPSQASVANLAKLAGLDEAELLARGATLAFVSPSRGRGDTLGDGVAGAYLKLPDGPAGAAVVYPAETYQTVQMNGTNKDGAVLVVGPATPPTAPTSHAYPVTLAASGSGLTFQNIVVFLRPGALVLHTLLPIR